MIEMVLEESVERAVIFIDAIEVKMVFGKFVTPIRETDNTKIVLQAVIQISNFAQVHSQGIHT